MKAQSIRLFDVFVLGPWLIWLSAKTKMTDNERVLLVLTGVSTIVYNGANYLEQAKNGD